MGEALVSPLIEFAVQNQISTANEEINFFRNFKKDWEKLKSSLLMIQKVLYDDEMKQVNYVAVSLWLKQLESIAFEADNVFDELHYDVLRNKMEKKVKNFHTHCSPVAFRRKMARKICCPIVFRRKMARKIKYINENLNSINKEAKRFGLRVMEPVDIGPNAVAARETDPFAVDPIFHGREDDVSGIVERLTTSTTEQPFLILAIVGMGGLGKKTLARQVFNDGKIKAHFDKQIWVHVSQKFDATVLFKKIVEQLTGGSFQSENRVVLVGELQKQLGAKRYLLVLDDIWNDKRDQWDNFFESLSGISSVMGNGIIVSTRGQNVASIVATLPIYELKSLQVDACWSVIKAKTFGQGEVPWEFEKIGRNIAERCGGLPLAAKVVGGLLRKKSRDEWRSIEETWLSKFGRDEDTISKVLKYSLDRLPSPSLKRCFAYCSIFSKGSSIERQQLIELWMAEGFLTIDGNNDMETVGTNSLTFWCKALCYNLRNLRKALIT